MSEFSSLNRHFLFFGSFVFFLFFGEWNTRGWAFPSFPLSLYLSHSLSLSILMTLFWKIFNSVVNFFISHWFRQVCTVKKYSLTSRWWRGWLAANLSFEIIIFDALISSCDLKHPIKMLYFSLAPWYRRFSSNLAF